MDQLGMFAVSRVSAAAVPKDVQRLAAALPRGLRMGTSSWSFPGWAGLVYAEERPADVLAQDGLGAYAQHPLLRTVGVDRTYYRPVSAAVYRGWREVVPSDFRFVVKAHDSCTIPRYGDHARYGVRAGTVNSRFLDVAYAQDAVVGPTWEGLGESCGVLLFQCPPQPAPSFGGPRKFAEDLYRFLRDLQAPMPVAVEVRTPDLLYGDYGQALRHAGAVHSHVVHPAMPSLAIQAQTVGELPGPRLIRWMLQRGYTYSQAKTAFAPFSELSAPDAAARASVAEHVSNRLDDCYVIANNKAEGCSPASLVALATSLSSVAATGTSAPQ